MLKATENGDGENQEGDENKWNWNNWNTVSAPGWNEQGMTQVLVYCKLFCYQNSNSICHWPTKVAVLKLT